MMDLEDLLEGTLFLLLDTDAAVAYGVTAVVAVFLVVSCSALAATPIIFHIRFLSLESP